MCNGLAQFDRQIPGTFSELESAIIAGRFPDRKAFLPHIPQSLRRLISKALEVDPRNRYATVLDLSNHLAGTTEQLDWQYTEVARPAAAGAVRSTSFCGPVFDSMECHGRVDHVRGCSWCRLSWRDGWRPQDWLHFF
jgi:serine/threonine protein kinase